MISEQVTDIQWMRKFYFQTGEALKNFLENEIFPSSSYSSLNSNCCSGMPLLKQVVLISSTFRSVKTLSSFPLQFSRAVCFGKICQYVFYSPVLLWLLLPAGPVSPHTHHLGSLVPKPWTEGHYMIFFSFFFLAMSGKQIHNDQEPLLPRSKSTLW